MVDPMSDTPDTRCCILEAADGLFRRFGFGKTTMAEIARDSNMSAANLYRYFDNKADIGAAIAEQCMCEGIELLRELVRKDGVTAAEKIETFTVALFNETYEALAEEPRMAELISFIGAERKELIREYKFEKSGSLVAEIIAEGNRTGEFNVADVVATSRAVITGIFAFHSPFLMMMGLFSKDEMERMAKDTARLLITGMATR
jgi:AcrR family transcriptional regulator